MELELGKISIHLFWMYGPYFVLWYDNRIAIITFRMAFFTPRYTFKIVMAMFRFGFDVEGWLGRSIY